MAGAKKIECSPIATTYQVLNAPLGLVVMQVDGRCDPDAELGGVLSNRTHRTCGTPIRRGPTTARRPPRTQRSHTDVPGDDDVPHCSPVSDS